MIASCARIVAFTIGLTLGFGPMAHAGTMANMSIEMPAVGAPDMPMPEGCDACGDAAAMAASGCFAYCAAPGAILPSPQRLAEAGGLVLALSADAAGADRHRLPDPHPPKSAR
jgi:hypothetical protein